MFQLFERNKKTTDASFLPAKVSTGDWVEPSKDVVLDRREFEDEEKVKNESFFSCFGIWDVQCKEEDPRV